MSAIQKSDNPKRLAGRSPLDARQIRAINARRASAQAMMKAFGRPIKNLY